MLLRWLKIISLSIVGLLLLLSVALTWLITTASGNHFLLNQATKFVPEMSLEAKEGSLWQGLLLENISYQQDDLTLKIDRAFLKISLKKLLQKELVVEQIYLNNLEINLAKSPEQDPSPSQPLELPSLLTPLPVEVADLKIASIRVMQAEVQLVNLESIELVANWQEELVIQQLSLATNQFDLGEPLELSLAGRGVDTNFYLENLSIAQAEQLLALSGELDWEDKPAWDVSGKAQHLNSGILDKDFPSDLSFSFQTSGYFSTPEDMQAKITLADLTGKFLQEEVAGNLTVSYSPEEIDFAVLLEVAHNFLQAQGKLQEFEEIDVKVQAQATNLARLSPELSGDLELDIIAQGKLTLPKLKGFLIADNLQFKEWQLETARLDLTPSKLQRLNLNLANLKQADEVLLDSLILKAEGDESEQNWSAKAQSQAFEADLSLAGKSSSKDLENWLIELADLTLEHSLIAKWRLAENSYLTANTVKQELKNLCLEQENTQAKLCVYANLTNLAGQVGGYLQNFELQPYSKYLDADAELVAQLNAEITAEILPNQEIQAQAKIEVNNGELRFLEVDKPLSSRPIQWEILEVLANLDKDDYQLKAEVKLNEQNYLTQELQGNLAKLTQLNGRLKLHFSDLNLIENFVPLEKVRGELLGDLSLSGDLDNPTAEGFIKLAKGFVEIPDLGLDLEDILLELTVNSAGELQLAGQINSEASQLRLNGRVQQQSDFLWPVDLAVTGQSFPLINLPDIQMRVSPDLTLNLEGYTIKTRGQVIVDSAQIKLKELPRSAISPTSDVIILGEEKEESPWILDTDIKVVLQDNFDLQGFGLKAKFAGDIQLQEKTPYPLTLNGIIKITEGRYKAYGQNLKIERGNILFQGAPENPGLDLVASRRLNKYGVTAGLEIGGTLNNPSSKVFSDPVMDDSEAMSYILFGKPLSGANESEGNALVQAIALYGIEQGEEVTQKISETLGLDFGFDTEGESDETALTVGKRLSPRLYLQYSVALFESLAAVILRYELTDNLDLETRSTGQENSVDLLYRKEFD